MTDLAASTARSATLERNERSLHALLELSKALSSEVDLDRLLMVIVENASSVIQAERTSVFIYDDERKLLWSRIAQGLAEMRIELPIGAGVAGDVAETRVLTNIADAYDDPRFSRDADRRSGFRTKSILCAPVVGSDGTLLGVLECVNKLEGEQFDQHDESLMTALASHVAVAIERARMIEAVLERERLNATLRMAHDIQMRMLPPNSASNSAFEFEARIRPARGVGGDLYDYFLADGRLYFCIGDVSGKGIPAALVMALTKTLIRANAALCDDPATIMTAANERLCEDTDVTMFVTSFCGFLDLATGELRYSNAGHEPAVVVGKEGVSRALDGAAGLPLGIRKGWKFVTHEAKLAPGETVFVFTDGVTEASNADSVMFEAERIHATLAGAAGSHPALLSDAMLTAIDNFCGDAPQYDDLTMMAIRFVGQS